MPNTILHGIDTEALAYLAVDSQKKTPVVMVIGRDHSHLQRLQEEIQFYQPDAKVLQFPAWDVQPYDRVGADSAIQAKRLEAACTVGQMKAGFILTTIGALSTKVPPPRFVQNSFIHLTVGQAYSRSHLLQQLEEGGYRNAETVLEPGEYAVRGGIMDVFPAGQELPLRLDFFDEELESIKTFDPASQRTLDSLKQAQIGGASEVSMAESRRQKFRQGYRSYFPNGQNDPIYVEVSAGRVHGLSGHYLPLFYDDPLVSLFDLLPQGTLVLQEQSAEHALQYRQDSIAEAYQMRLSLLAEADKGDALVYRPLPPEALYLSDDEWQKVLGEQNITTLSPFKDELAQEGWLKGHITYRRRDPQHSVMELLTGDIRAAQKNGQRVILSALSPSGIEHLKDALEKEGIDHLQGAEAWAAASAQDVRNIQLLTGPVKHGFHDTRAKIYLVTEEDLFGEKQVQKQSKRKKADIIQHMNELQPGDLVVHTQHGIARYEGMHTLTLADSTQDYLLLTYQGGDKLYVPVVNLDVLTRYRSGEDGAEALLDKLGGGAWQARKEKVRKQLFAMAGDLLQVAAARAAMKGHRYNQPDGLYDEFCARFPYVLTDEQATAIEDVLSDMYGGRLMDRLVVGDVGFGKTEVALRAAFVAAANGKQVALVAPTTLLALQHYETFKARFEGFPFHIGMLSRLNTTKQAADTRQGLKNGEVDILVGTHAVLSESVGFHDLGLVIVDEEQRFGVKHKERLKQLRESVDVLTLTATPIPRTLQMSLTGIKTLSTITTPPVDRLAVRSYVMPYDPKVVREAIMREIFRGGQVYMVTPRIQDMVRLAEQIQNLVPEASVVTAHGQMGAEALDEVMHRFYHGEVHVLLATSIIESGLDVPRANTIIVFEADRFGLAQLYQLKGRVGRSKVRAYAYFMLPFSRGLSDDAEKRLKVLQRLEGLGAGFTLASYDMDIRGPGNLLGKEQSGHIQDVGFELYNQMLGEAIASYKAHGAAQEVQGSFTPVLNLGMTFLIPNEYVKETNVRLGLYRRLANISADVEVAEFKDELLDRFGPVPPEVEALLEVILLKNRCKLLNIEKIEIGEKGTVLGFYKNTFAKPDALLHYILQNSGLISLRHDQSVVFHRKWADQQARLKGITWLLDQLEKL